MEAQNNGNFKLNTAVITNEKFLQSGRPVFKVLPSTSGFSDIKLWWKRPAVVSQIYGYDIEVIDSNSKSWFPYESTIIVEDTKARKHNSILLSFRDLPLRFRVSALLKTGLRVPSDSLEPLFLFPKGLTGLSPPHWLSSPPPEILCLLSGQDLSLQVHAKGKPEVSFTWIKDSQELFVSERNFIRSTRNFSCYRFESISPNESGIYFCSVSNSVGRIFCKTNVIVFCKPFFKENLIQKTYFYRVNDMIRISLPYVSTPSCKFRLSHSFSQDGTLSFTKNSAIFKITSARVEHSGKWILEASNSLGKAQIVLDLLIHSVPEKPGKPEVKVDSNSYLSLTWRASSGATGYFLQYFAESLDLWLHALKTSEASCILRDYIYSDSYKFRVVAFNDFGSSEPSESSVSLCFPVFQSLESVPLEVQSFSSASLPSLTLEEKQVFETSMSHLVSDLLQVSSLKKTFEYFLEKENTTTSTTSTSTTSTTSSTTLRKYSLQTSYNSNIEKSNQRHSSFCSESKVSFFERDSKTKAFTQKNSLKIPTKEASMSLNDIKARISSLQNLLTHSVSLSPFQLSSYQASSLESINKVSSVRRASGLLETHFPSESELKTHL